MTLQEVIQAMLTGIATRPLEAVALGVFVWLVLRLDAAWGKRYSDRTEVQQESAAALKTLAERDSHTIRVEEGQRLPVEVYDRPSVTSLMDPDASQH